MKKKYYIFTAITAYCLFLVATIPAKPLIGAITKDTPIKMQGVSGTLWNGKAYAITVNRSIQLNNTDWSLSLWKLLTARVAVDIKTRYYDNDIRGELGMSFFGRYFVNDLKGSIPAKQAASLANIPLAQLDGTITLDITHAAWKQGELPIASGQINWKNARITVAETVSLGNVIISLDESEQELLVADIKNQGGDLKVTGSAELVPEADYAVNLNLSPVSSSNRSIEQSLGMFAKKQANGDYLFKQSGPLNQLGLM
jgi:general secretion pathway protein N